MGYMLNMGISVDTEDYQAFVNFVECKLEALRSDLKIGKTGGNTKGTYAGARTSAIYRIDTNTKCYKVRVWQKNYEDVLVYALNPIEARNVVSEKYEDGKITLHNFGEVRSFDTELATYDDTLNHTDTVFKAASVDAIPMSFYANPKDE